MGHQLRLELICSFSLLNITLTQCKRFYPRLLSDKAGLDYTTACTRSGLKPYTYLLFQSNCYLLLIYFSFPVFNFFFLCVCRGNFHLYHSLAYILINQRNISDPNTTNFAWTPYDSSIAVAARTNDCAPSGPRSVWWTATSDCYVGWGFFLGG